MNRKILLLASVAAAILSAPIAFASPGDPGEGAPKQGPADPKGAGHEGRGPRRTGARHAVRFLRMLELSDAQKAQLSDARTAAEPVRADAHAKVRAILDEAKKGERTPEVRAKIRGQVKAVLVAARSQVEPSAKRMLDSLTPEQRARIAERAAAHGKTLDDAKLLQRFERLILSGRGVR